MSFMKEKSKFKNLDIKGEEDIYGVQGKSPVILLNYICEKMVGHGVILNLTLI